MYCVGDWVSFEHLCVLNITPTRISRVATLQTELTEIELTLDVCKAYEFRVASVNQFGTQGFNDELRRQG